MHVSMMKYFLAKIKLKLTHIFFLNPRVNKFGNPSSFPFLSGDTFRSFADYIIENCDDLNSFVENFRAENKKIKTLFISISFIENNFKILKKKFLEIYIKKDIFKKTNIIFHKGDTQLSLTLLNFFEKKFNKIFIVNQIKKTKKIYPIPLGIENYSLQRNGVTTFYQEYRKNRKNIKNIKSQLIFSSFNVVTNIKQREYLKNLINLSRHNFCGSSLSSEKYLYNLSKSFFTLSPPGNGNDCHRTWEAIYLDCIPIIKKGFLSPYLSDNLPILVVDSWKVLLEKSDDELLRIYKKLIKKKNSMAFAEFWFNYLRNN